MCCKKAPLPFLLKVRASELLLLNPAEQTKPFFFFFFSPLRSVKKHLHVESPRRCPVIEMLGGNLLPSSAWKCSTQNPLIKQKMVCHV